MVVGQMDVQDKGKDFLNYYFLFLFFLNNFFTHLNDNKVMQVRLLINWLDNCVDNRISCLLMVFFFWEN